MDSIFGVKLADLGYSYSVIVFKLNPVAQSYIHRIQVLRKYSDSYSNTYKKKTKKLVFAPNLGKRGHIYAAA